VLQCLREHQLAVKRNKCSFEQPTVTYLGHVIFEHDVAIDAKKVATVQAWPPLRTIRAVRGFLGLTGYYRKFIRSYGEITGPLTKLLKREAFRWSLEAVTTFESLMATLTSTLVLQLPDFAQSFVVDCDASRSGIEAMLHQGQGPIAFLSKAMAPHHAKLVAYERELIGLVKVVRHWRLYLWLREFVVRTDHFSLKYLLDQRLSTVPQHNWVSKIFGYQFYMEFKPGKQNAAADALSQRDEEISSVCALSLPTFELYDQLCQESTTLSALM
jgi:hypothetical protein